MLHVLIGTNDADYESLRNAPSGRPLPKWIVPKRAEPGDTVVFFVPAYGFVATGTVVSIPEQSTFRDRVAYRSPVRDVKMLAAPMQLERIGEAIPDWAWTRYPRTFTTPESHIAERLLKFLSSGAQPVASKSAKEAKSGFLFGWKPELGTPVSIADSVIELREKGTTTRSWRSGNRRTLPVNSRAYMIRLGQGPCGIIGAGWTRTEPDEEPPSVDIEFELLSETPFIPIETLQLEAPFSEVHWTPQGSGVSLPSDVVAALDT